MAFGAWASGSGTLTSSVLDGVELPQVDQESWGFTGFETPIQKHVAVMAEKSLCTTLCYMPVLPFLGLGIPVLSYWIVDHLTLGLLKLTLHEVILEKYLESTIHI